MVDWRDPARIKQDYLIFLKLNHVIGGLYIWEMVTTCRFELNVLRGKRPYRWTIWIYLLVRTSTLLTIILFFIDNDAWGLRNCKAWGIVIYIFAYIGAASASCIILIRTVAIWNFHPPVITLCLAVWLASKALNVRDVTMIKSVYQPQFGLCMPIETNKSFANTLGILVTDFTLLTTMLVGLRRLRTGDEPIGLWRLLFHQGLIWLALATIAEVPNVIMAGINLSDPWNIMFQLTALVILAISATRMYRDLSEYGSITTFIADSTGDPMSQPLAFRRQTVSDATVDGATDTISITVHVESGRVSESDSDATVCERKVAVSDSGTERQI
ncbi:hypothetical protein BV25DRAFT_1920985 [Artomyces pyxidatus]|uniref:Uncharacterized protein n=1 Tax=Artomyces pyxidatus TaxID=48021 RepID=A0ACB8SK30_9AGAM|nr:hypothetical protein BV25DRAFT_1920985 [Artomyces pyxidatus]